MIKSNKDSKIEVWGTSYINEPEKRSEADKNSVIIQIEQGDKDDNYIVEVINPDK